MKHPHFLPEFLVAAVVLAGWVGPTLRTILILVRWFCWDFWICAWEDAHEENSTK
jgi:hypothetical protein